MTAPPWLKSAWPHLRAAFVLFHVVALFLMAIPAPGGGMSKSAWADPTVQGEFQAWTERLNDMGADITVEELEDRLWSLATVYMEKRKTVLDPIAPYYRYTGTTQSWRMFVAPHRYPARLHIEVEEGGTWREVYVMRSEEHAWRAEQLDNDRMRAAIFRMSWRPYRRIWVTFTEWAADRAAEDFPEATRIRLRFFKYKTQGPKEIAAGKELDGNWIQTVMLDLEQRR
ncbi:MAG: hypothetical protein GY884_03075 [Proteobacteria bacterium]|nr:hypothetical protein [Pseudomonadota bacterium]